MEQQTYISKEEYWDALSDLLKNHIERSELPIGGLFHPLTAEEAELLRAARTLLENDRRDVSRHSKVIKKLHDISGSMGGDGSSEIYVSDRFEQALQEFVRRKPIHWGSNRVEEGFENFQKLAHHYLFRFMPSTPESDCVVWHRKVKKESLDLPDPQIALTGNKTPHMPQVYFIPGILDYSPITDEGFALLPSQQTAIDGFDLVSQWARKNGDADVYYIQKSPIGNIRKSKDDPDACNGCAQAFIHRFLLADIAQYKPEEGWRRLPSLESVKANLSRHTFVGCCYGGVWQQAFQDQMYRTMLDLGYNEQEAKECLNALGMVAFGFRRSSSGAHPHIPTLTVCNTEDAMTKSHTYDFLRSQNVKNVLGVIHGMQGQTLHIENTFAADKRYIKEDGQLIPVENQDYHSMRGYTQLNERILRRGKVMETYRAHLCAPCIRETIDTMIEAGRLGIRDGGHIIQTVREKHLNPQVLQRSALELAEQERWFFTQLNRSGGTNLY